MIADCWLYYYADATLFAACRHAMISAAIFQLSLLSPFHYAAAIFIAPLAIAIFADFRLRHAFADI